MPEFRQKIEAVVVAEIRRRAELGVPLDRIARELEVNSNTVRDYVVPGYRERRRAFNAEWQRKRYAKMYSALCSRFYSAAGRGWFFWIDVGVEGASRAAVGSMVRQGLLEREGRSGGADRHRYRLTEEGVRRAFDGA